MSEKKFKKICRMTQEGLKNYVGVRLTETHETVISQDGFVFAKGTFPVLLVAHLDTVHTFLPYEIKYDKKLKALWSPNGIGGDDRCGVYMILEIVKKYNCSVLFCEEEEVGGIGAKKFTQSPVSKDLSFNYIIEFDRKGKNDAVFYDCDNEDFEKFITKEHFKTAFGTFSDISVVAPYLKCAAVNLSCGYYNAHTVKEYVVLEEMNKNIEQACKILERTTEEDKFEYVERVYSGRYYSGWYDDYYEDWDGYYSEEAKSEEDEEDCYYFIEYEDIDGKTQYDEQYAVSTEEAVGKLLMDHPEIPFCNVVNIYDENFIRQYR